MEDATNLEVLVGYWYYGIQAWYLSLLLKGAYCCSAEFELPQLFLPTEVYVPSFIHSLITYFNCSHSLSGSYYIHSCFYQLRLTPYQVMSPG